MPNRRHSTWPQFLAWSLCGASSALVLLGAFTIGPLAVVPAGAFAALALGLGGRNVSAVGTIAGVGVWGLVLAWLNRNGPGVVCSNTSTGGTCAQQWSPWPFVVGAVSLVGVTVALFMSSRRRDTAMT